MTTMGPTTISDQIKQKTTDPVCAITEKVFPINQKLLEYICVINESENLTQAVE